MINRTPTPRDERPALPAFDAVPRLKPRHDGWTPARQVAFIEALADTGSVKSAAAQVNMSTESAYALRRAPGAAGFTRAWEAALDMGVLRLKDEAFERALHGELVPIVSAGKLFGYRRKRNDYLLMFLLRHYTESGGQRVPVDALRSPAKRGTIVAASEPPHSPLPAPPASAAATVADFAGVSLDEEAQAQIVAVLTACAARTRACAPADDAAEPHVAETEMPPDHPDAIHAPGVTSEDYAEPRDGDEDWRTLDLPDPRPAIAAAVASVEASKTDGRWEAAGEEVARQHAEQERKGRFRAFLDSGQPLDYWKG